ncbi:ComEC/Rec2 family competence protein [Ruegeria sp. PrR005]|uniref:ComEC family competence protein n=1 Tax=Ruegeria sp. PrR005 TaxID=2706882 RepID=A0A6B2NQK3_9RHOB|nr:ComEC/Rec2 family competence protein [Ruegeria sp. PrR005]NDW44125.1 ComEC family competence protein [Ruegeria sp. PrR005]
MRVLARIERGLLEQRGHLFPWVPVFLGIGIGFYFLPRQEPGTGGVAFVACVALVLAVLARRVSAAWSPLLWALVLVNSGFLLAAGRAHYVSAPVLDWRYYGPVEGRVIALDRSASDRLRVTLDRVRMDRIAADEVPDQVRISLSDDTAQLPPGGRVMTMAHLAPPQGPVEPGGFDFRRHAWFQRLGAIGYTRTPMLVAAPADTSAFRLRLLAVRTAASDRIREQLPGDVGGFAAAVTTGDRSGVSQSALMALRASNLAHLLAISGLHMGLLAGFVFAALRVGLSLIPSLALRLPVRKLAAIGALLVAAGYLALSGGNVATQRAFVMVAVMLGAVLVDRRALSLRAVAAAATGVLLLRPEALLGPGFQMSFAATVALVAVFGWIRDAEISLGPRWLHPVAGLVVSSAVAGLATAPVAAAHFNTIAHYGLLANLVSVPLMGVLIIPAAVLALVLAPISLDWIGLDLMGLGLTWILEVAHWTAGIEGAQGFVARPGAEVLPLLALGWLWIVLWRGRLRLVGVPVIAASLVMWSLAERPEILVADTGGLVGIMTPEGRALSKPRGSGFIAGVWLENDGDGADQPTAAARWPGEGSIKRIRSGAVEIVHVTGKRGAQQLSGCTKTEIVISSVPLDLNGPCMVFDPASLSRTGAVSLTQDGKLSAIAGQERRLWSPTAQRDQ